LVVEEEQDLRCAIELSMQEISAVGISDNQPSYVGCAAPSDTSSDRDRDLCSANREFNVFGVIKDVKISNIVATDGDKTVQFEAKNFKHIFGQSLVGSPLAESSVAAVSFRQDELSSVAGCSDDC
jgi:hypothetical protein